MNQSGRGWFADKYRKYGRLALTTALGGVVAYMGYNNLIKRQTLEPKFLTGVMMDPESSTMRAERALHAAQLPADYLLGPAETVLPAIKQLITRAHPDHNKAPDATERTALLTMAKTALESVFGST